MLAFKFSSFLLMTEIERIHPQMKQKMKMQMKNILKTQIGMRSWLQLQSYCLLIQFQRFVLHFMPNDRFSNNVLPDRLLSYSLFHQNSFALIASYWQINKFWSIYVLCRITLAPRLFHTMYLMEQVQQRSSSISLPR